MLFADEYLGKGRSAIGLLNHLLAQLGAKSGIQLTKRDTLGFKQVLGSTTKSAHLAGINFYYWQCNFPCVTGAMPEVAYRYSFIVIVFVVVHIMPECTLANVKTSTASAPPRSSAFVADFTLAPDV